MSIGHMNTIAWEVKLTAPPKTMRYCKKCGAKTEHVSSGAFRVNAQRKNLDVWLIYRCARCKTTWNLTIFSRVNSGSIGQELLGRFLANDPALALRYAADADLLNGSGAETGEPACYIQGGEIDPFGDTRIRLSCEYPLKLRVAKLIREKLALSKKDFEEMAARGAIRMENGADIGRAKLGREAYVIVARKPPMRTSRDSVAAPD